MTPLSEIAKDVAEALELTPICFNGQWSWWIAKQPEDVPALSQDGSNLTDPYWRCACEDWLVEQGYRFACLWSEHRAWISDEVAVICPWPEAPARLVSAVWRRMKEKT